MNRTSNRPRKPVMKLQFMNLVRDCVPCEQTNGLNPIRKAVLNQAAAYFDSHNTKFCMPYDEVARYWSEHRKPLSEVQFISTKLGLGKRATTEHLKALAQWGWIRFENVSEVDGCYDYRITPPHELPSLDGQYVICMQSTTGGVHPNNTPPVVEQHAPCIEKTPLIYNKDLKTLKTSKTQEKGGGVLQDQSEDEQTPPPAVEAEQPSSQEEPPPIGDGDLIPSELRAFGSKQQPRVEQPTIEDSPTQPEQPSRDGDVPSQIRRQPQDVDPTTGVRAQRANDIISEIAQRIGVPLPIATMDAFARRLLASAAFDEHHDNEWYVQGIIELYDDKVDRLAPRQALKFAISDLKQELVSTGSGSGFRTAEDALNDINWDLVGEEVER